MLTGRPAFHGRSAIDTMQAVLTQPVPPLSAGAGSSAESTAELQRIIGKCTAKEPDDRFQGMKDLIVDLRTARRRLESSSSWRRLAAVGARRTLALRTLGSAAAVALMAVIGAAASSGGGRTSPPAVTPSGKPAIAVLYFENNTGEQSLDWMRIGLTDMIVTDLSQSTDIEVLGTDRLVQILQELKRADDRVVSADVVKEIASRAGVDNVLVGSYVRAGGTIRISARLQEARTGRIIGAERVEGAGESALFGLVDELTRRVRSKMTELTAGRGAAPLLPRPGEARSGASTAASRRSRPRRSRRSLLRGRDELSRARPVGAGRAAAREGDRARSRLRDGARQAGGGERQSRHAGEA